MRYRMFLALAIVALPLATGRSQRPSLPRDKDPNDWEAYYYAGVDWLAKNNGRAEEDFANASHLRLQLQARRVPAAREALGRTVVENAAFAPAHAMLGEIAFSRNDTATTLLEYGLAAETDPTDVEIRIGRGKALRQAGQGTQAIAEFRKAIVLEPLYATPYFMLAAALEESGDKPGATEAYSLFLSHATRDDPRRAQVAQKLLALKGL